MLKGRILKTLNFFALQGIPLTLFELHKYLLNDLGTIQQHLSNTNWEVVTSPEIAAPCEVRGWVSMADIAACLREECQSEVRSFRGYHFLAQETAERVNERLRSYVHGIKRERRILRYGSGVRYLPFVRGLGLVGSQALGQYRERSDIDVLIFVEPEFLWVARFFITCYFQILGMRRHGKLMTNRFCLNHYVGGAKALCQDRNIYTAAEYAKLRPLYPSVMLNEFKRKIALGTFVFPHIEAPPPLRVVQPWPELCRYL